MNKHEFCQLTFSPIRFEFHRLDDLPRLAWCARMIRGDPVVHVYHGPWVETRPEGFCEGAWNGEFSEFGFHEAAMFTGTGARLTVDGLYFVTASDRINCIYSKRDANVLCVSNSRLFLLVVTGDGYDPAYTYYYTQMLMLYSNKPYWVPDKFLRTREGKIELHDYGNFLLSPGLRLTRKEKPDLGVPRDFRHYRDLLLTATTRLFANAADDARRIRYDPLTALSRGYDSTAVSVIAQQAGCREAMTFAAKGGKDNPDSGTGIAQALNIYCHAVDQYAYRQYPDVAEAEFCADGFTGYHVSYASMEALLPQRVLCNGYLGAMWRSEQLRVLPGLVTRNTYTAGGGITEFRLRVGFQMLSMISPSAIHAREVLAISRSREMAPWRLGNGYDKPIARRILEEAGVSREAFGQRKQVSGTNWLTGREAFTPHAWQDFMAYYAELQDRVPARDWFWPRLLYKGICDYELALSKLCRLHSGLKRWSYLRSPKAYKEQQWPWEIRFTMHWGCARIRDRYRPALEQARVLENAAFVDPF